MAAAASGKGVAYSTTEPAHLLNVRAEGMSAWAGEPDHFAKHFEAEGGDPSGFAQRRLFGALSWRDSRRSNWPADNVRTRAATAMGATREDGGWRVELDDGRIVEARALVLADRQPGAGRAARVRRSRASASSAIRGAGRRGPLSSELAASGERALLVGTGLTMVDLVLSLDAAGHRGQSSHCPVAA